jgi:hypothetical protein
MRKISFCAAGVALLILIGLGIGTSTRAAASTSCPGLPYCDPATGISYRGANRAGTSSGNFAINGHEQQKLLLLLF